MELNPDNTLTHYVTALPQRISLVGQWECGLVEIQYPHTWYNVREEDVYFGVNADGMRYEVNIEAGHYGSPQALTRAINRIIKSPIKEKQIKLSYSDITQKVTIHMVENISFSVYSLKLQRLLGLSQNVYITPEEEGPDYYYVKEAESVVDMAQGFYSLYVYTDLVEPRVVGDAVVPLLRAVPIEGKHGDVVSKSFDNVQYVPVLHKEFTTIEIDIRDDTGRRVPFERGRVTATLHFRRRKPSFFET